MTLPRRTRSHYCFTSNYYGYTMLRTSVGGDTEYWDDDFVNVDNRNDMDDRIVNGDDIDDVDRNENVDDKKENIIKTRVHMGFFLN